MRKTWFFFLILCNLSVARGQEDSLKSAAEPSRGLDKMFDLADQVVDFISGEKWSIIPAITYAPETRLGLGLRAIRLFEKSDSLSRPSSLPLTFLYTLRNQIIFTAELDHWMKENTKHLNVRLELVDFPFVFYGIGNDTQREASEDYASRFIRLNMSYEFMIARGLYLGPQLEYRAEKLYRNIAGGLLESGDTPGSNGFNMLGGGAALLYDTRDNIFQPRRGQFHQLRFLHCASVSGDTYGFQRIQADLRQYIPVYKRQMLVLQLWYQANFGATPFQQLSLLGGSDVMRGFFEGRYRDLQGLALQGEYRMPLHRKLGMVWFAGTGQVMPAFSDFHTHRFHYGGGIGFRYRIHNEGLNLRIDFAYGDRMAWYFGLNEVL
ncbi:MAG: BamA/TamA family outer membrane protein [Cyclobacteriaceae bacterium]|nr:BamA/TamA family outer membrane protein [Cyclobacteriaceae bacterium]